MLRVAAMMALLFALSLSAFETYINWGQWQWWPSWLVDYVSAGLLLAGGVMALRGSAIGPMVLTCGWGFAISMMWMSLANNIAEGTDPDRAGRVAGLYIALIAFSLLWCLIGLFLTFVARSVPQSNE